MVGLKKRELVWLAELLKIEIIHIIIPCSHGYLVIIPQRFIDPQYKIAGGKRVRDPLFQLGAIGFRI